LTEGRALRRDPTTGAWVALSTERVLRPTIPRDVAMLRTPPDACPFCPGHEAFTPPTLAAWPPTGAWAVRAFANRYPALRVEGALERRGRGPYDDVTGIGAHEVIVEAPDHDVRLCHQPDPVLAAGLRLARDRIADLQRDPRLVAITWFRNHGTAAGASISHPHAQIVGTPELSSQLQVILERSRAHRARTGRDLLADVLDHERDDGSRIVADGPIVTLCPWAPLTPFELWLVPTAAEPDFARVSDERVTQLARAMGIALRALEAELGDVPYNAFLVTAPTGARAEDGFRWHIRVRPRLTTAAGFELATGGAMHHAFPETTAALLRQHT
jgi:UDPglucose--hexose-1-phosphate uridylyltransferase